MHPSSVTSRSSSAVVVVSNVILTQDNTQVVQKAVLMDAINMMDVKFRVEAPVPMLCPALRIKQQRHANDPRDNHATLPSVYFRPAESECSLLVGRPPQKWLLHSCEKLLAVPQGKVHRVNAATQM
jgi:hypothetical protein